MDGLAYRQRILLTPRCREHPSKELPPQYICARCKKPRSRGFRATHPLQSNPDMQMGICSRPHCAKQQSEKPSFVVDPPPQVVVHHVHHYYHETRPPDVPLSRNDMENRHAGPSYTIEPSTVAELPGDEPGPMQRNCRENQRQTLIKPQINYDRKPVLIRQPSLIRSYLH